MGQYWQIINIDKRETLGFQGKLGEFFFSSHEALADMIRFLHIPTEPSTSAKSGATAAKTSVLGALSVFPAEILNLIFERTDSFADAICLGYVHADLLAIGRQRIEALHAAEAAPWLGGRIMCIGDYIRDVPQGVLTPAEEDEIKGGGEDDNDNDDHDHGEIDNLYDLVSQRYARVAPPSLESSLFLRLDRQLVLDMFRVPPLAAPWVLCNLSKHEYVRAGVIARIPNASGIDLGTVLLSRICWSSDPSASMSYGGNLTRGEWAGDRFEVVTEERLKHLQQGDDEWTDVSKTAANEMTAIMRSDYY